MLAHVLVALSEKWCATEISIDRRTASFMIEQEFFVFLLVYDGIDIFFLMLSHVLSIKVNCILWDNIVIFEFFRRYSMIMALYVKL
jgi:hypothetical protein